jgi:hypothetical protein
MFYGAYVGIHSIVRAELGAEIDESKLASKQIQKEDSNNKPDPAKTAYYYDIGLEKEESSPKYQQFTVIQIVYIGQEPAVPRSWRSNSLFSRPPPAA